MTSKKFARLSGLLLLTLLCLSFPAKADDETPTPATQALSPTYSPPACEFTVTFPSEPYVSRRCDDVDKNKCYDQISYTKVYGLESTVNFRVICNPIDKKIYDYYSDEVMVATLRAMTKHSIVKTYDTSHRTEEGYKQAGLVGEGKSGTLPTLYIAQLWIGHGSAFSVEAEMIGDPNDKMDKMFSEILKSVRYLTDDERAEKGIGAPAKKPEDKEGDRKDKKDDKKPDDKPTEKKD